MYSWTAYGRRARLGEILFEDDAAGEIQDVDVANVAVGEFSAREIVPRPAADPAHSL